MIDMVQRRGSKDGASGPPNMHHVAELAGVSVATVSNVLNHPEKVAEATRDKVFSAIDRLGFTLNQTARALRSGEARTIGLVVIDLTNSLFVDGYLTTPGDASDPVRSWIEAAGYEIEGN